MQPQRLEIVQYQERGEYLDMQVALDGTLAVGMEIHKSAREAYPTEPAWIEYLTRCAQSLIQLYGDARYPRRIQPEEMLAGV